MPTKKESAHLKLKEELEKLSNGIHFIFEVRYIAPTCLKCDGFLSEAHGSPNLICLRCGIAYELKEQVT
jgi:hypothetical protein